MSYLPTGLGVTAEEATALREAAVARQKVLLAEQELARLKEAKAKEPGFLSKFWTGLTTVLSERERAAAAAAPPAAYAKPTPSWLLPVGIGAGVLVLILLLKKKG